MLAAQVDTGDTAWMLAATALVLLMTPALGLFYAGLVRVEEHAEHVHDVRRRARRSRRVTWALVGYSLAFDEGNGFIGGFDHAFLHDVDVRAARRARRSRTCSSSPSRRPSASSPSALVSGAVVERMRFGAVPASSRRCGRSSSTPCSRTGRSAAAGCRRAGRSTSPAACRSRWAPASRRSRRRSSSARARTTGARRCCRTTRSTCCSAPACCGSAGSASTAAAASRPATPACSRSPTRC